MGEHSCQPWLRAVALRENVSGADRVVVRASILYLPDLEGMVRLARRVARTDYPSMGRPRQTEAGSTGRADAIPATRDETQTVESVLFGKLSDLTSFSRRNL